ncbi:hypothetical protein TNCV_4769011 [Trichonephila clavipes]|nr:hypothetical protein TNCV_4769011 [Trichonephila clavipes]
MSSSPEARRRRRVSLHHGQTDHALDILKEFNLGQRKAATQAAEDVLRNKQTMTAQGCRGSILERLFVLCYGTSYHHISYASSVPWYRKDRIETFISRPVHTYMIEPTFVADYDPIPFGCRQISSIATHLYTETMLSGVDGPHDSNCPSARRLVVVRTDTEARSEGADWSERSHLYFYLWFCSVFGGHFFLPGFEIWGTEDVTVDVFLGGHFFLPGFEVWGTEDVIVDGKLLDVEVVGSITEGLVTVDKAVNIGESDGRDCVQFTHFGSRESVEECPTDAHLEHVN